MEEGRGKDTPISDGAMDCRRDVEDTAVRIVPLDMSIVDQPSLTSPVVRSEARKSARRFVIEVSLQTGTSAGPGSTAM